MVKLIPEVVVVCDVSDPKVMRLATKIVVVWGISDSQVGGGVGGLATEVVSVWDISDPRGGGGGGEGTDNLSFVRYVGPARSIRGVLVSTDLD